MKRGFISIGECICETLIAETVQDQEKGLMFVEAPVPTMSFTYASPRVNRFWMHNTPEKLDIIFCCNGRVTEICQGIPFNLSAVGSNDLSDLVVEFPFGTAQELGITVGSSVKLIA